VLLIVSCYMLLRIYVSKLFPTRRSSDLLRLCAGTSLVARRLDDRSSDRGHGLGVAPAFGVPHRRGVRFREHRFRPRAGESRFHRSEEHTSELQSPCKLVCRLLLEKKKCTDGGPLISEHLTPSLFRASQRRTPHGPLSSRRHRLFRDAGILYSCVGSPHRRSSYSHH